jgi:secretion/DNA translocation related TadE-like protein
MTRDRAASAAAGRDHGSATLWALALVLVLWLSVAGVLLAGIAIAARHRAATAADLAALSAASALSGAASWSGAVTGTTPGATPAPAGVCAHAQEIANANGATIASCQVSGAVVEVTASVPVNGLRYLGVDSVSARARAGPG